MKSALIFAVTFAISFAFLQFYAPARDALVYGCGVIAGQDSIKGENREPSYCVAWRERAEGVGFTPFR